MNHIRECETVLFDLDGTLTDPAPGITACIQYALEHLGQTIPPPEELYWCIGPPLPESFANLLPSANMVDEAVLLYRQRFGEKGLFENRVYEGVPEMLAAYKSHKNALYVASSKPHIFVQRILEHFDLAHYFEDAFGSELDGTNSDKKELLSYVLKQTGISPASTIMVGDRKHDIIGALHNNISPIGVTYGYGSFDELKTAGAAMLVDTPAVLHSKLLA